MNIFNPTVLPDEYIVIAVFSTIGLIIGVILVIYSYFKRRNKKVFEKSSVLKKLVEINKKYDFKEAPMLQLYGYKFLAIAYSKDPFDKVFIKNYSENETEISKGLVNAEYNRKLFKEYENEIKEECHLGIFYDVNKKKLNKYKKIESKLFKKLKLKPVLEYKARVVLSLGRSMVRHTYSEDEVLSLISAIKKHREEDAKNK